MQSLTRIRIKYPDSDWFGPWIRICIKSSIWIRIETNADPQHWLIETYPWSRIRSSNSDKKKKGPLPRLSYGTVYLYHVTSVADPWHFGVEPDPDPDPRIHASD